MQRVRSINFSFSRAHRPSPFPSLEDDDSGSHVPRSYARTCEQRPGRRLFEGDYSGTREENPATESFEGDYSHTCEENPARNEGDCSDTCDEIEAVVHRSMATKSFAGDSDSHVTRSYSGTCEQKPVNNPVREEIVPVARRSTAKAARPFAGDSKMHVTRSNSGTSDEAPATKSFAGESNKHVTRTSSGTSGGAPASEEIKPAAIYRSPAKKSLPEESSGHVTRSQSTTCVESSLPRAREDEAVDRKADDFINKFKQQLKMQRIDSILKYKEMLNRGTSI